MITTTLDIICRRCLLERSLPIHFYSEYLFHSATCLRELNFDVLKIVNSANLPVDNTGNVILPADFTEDIAVCIPGGQGLSKLPKQDWITPIRIHDSTGQYVPYDNTSSTKGQEQFFGYPWGVWTWFFNVDSFGFPTGRFYGAGGGTGSGYTVFKQQRRIQMSQDFAGSNVVLLYVGDGSSVDNATQIDPQAFATINAFIIWKSSPNRDNDYSPEGRGFALQRRKLVARLDDVDIPWLRNTLHQNYFASPKN